MIDFARPHTRIGLMVVLVCAFVFQTVLVYSDDTAMQMAPLSPTALEGRALWHEHNCQACHQIYGFGGFLGPDLTNAAGRLTPEMMHEVLTDGVGQMPAFGFTSDEIVVMHAYLVELDRTGTSQPRKFANMAPLAAVDAVAEHAPMSVEQLAGREIYAATCQSCHLLGRDNLVGANLASDLITSAATLNDAELANVLQFGRPEDGMPGGLLDPTQLGEVAAFLAWLVENQTSLALRLTSSEESGIPWFTYPR